jgi:hypothetical protein
LFYVYDYGILKQRGAQSQEYSTKNSDLFQKNGNGSINR